MDEHFDDLPKPDIAADFARQHHLSKGAFRAGPGIIVASISLASLILTGILFFVGMTMEPAGVGDMRGLVHFYFVTMWSGLGITISALLALIASFLDRRAVALLVVELILLVWCLAPVWRFWAQ